MSRPLIYCGPSISPEQARKIVPEAIIRPPAQQSDVISDLCELNPSHLLLIDGTFMQNLAVWVKEMVYALLYPSLEGRVYGSSSMGALQAATMSAYGMIGHGRIFEWYEKGVTADDAEVAVAYSVLQSGVYRSVTVPMADVRATLEDRKELPDTKENLWLKAKQIHWSERTEKALSSAWKISSDQLTRLLVRQKKLDALSLLRKFRALAPLDSASRLSSEGLNPLFYAQFERDRRFPTTRVRQHDFVSHLALSDPEARRTFRNAENRSTLLFLADSIGIGSSIEEINLAKGRFLAELGLKTREQFDGWLSNNFIREADLDRLIVEETRIGKLRNAFRVSRMTQKCTQPVLDWLILENRLGEALSENKDFLEAEIDVPPLAPDESVAELLRLHLEGKKIPASGHFGNFITEYSFEGASDLYYSLAREYSV